MKRGKDDRGHYYVVRCTVCPSLVEHFDKRPLAAYRKADKHARKNAGHEAYVLNLTRLTVAYRKRYDALLLPGNEIPF